MATSLPLGPLMVGVAGLELSAAEQVRLLHPAIGGVILFTRNYAAPEQLRALTASIRAVRSPTLLIAVDHEGGRVQRFRDGFTRIPPMRELGNLWDHDRAAALVMAQDIGYVIACELAAHGIDFSFAPVLDVDHGNSSVIGNRALHNHADAVTALACALQGGMARAGMITVGKHFPGHGYAHADSHVAVPTDERAFVQIEAHDLMPFARMTLEGMGAVMPAHVVYPVVDELPAGYSRRWLQSVLRERLGFQGAIISDDLGMEGASTAGGILDRAHAALDAGCDLILSCNDEAAAQVLLDGLTGNSPESAQRLIALHVCRVPDLSSSEYSQARERVAAFAKVVMPEDTQAARSDIVANL